MLLILRTEVINIVNHNAIYFGQDYRPSGDIEPMMSRSLRFGKGSSKNKIR